MTAIADDRARKAPLNRGRRYRLPVGLFAVLALAACAETEIVFQTAKKIVGMGTKAPPSTGAYKVGRPYQVNGTWYYPAADYNYRETGIASWYGAKFHGKRTANGETYDMNRLSAAHRTLPLPSMVRVVNLRNGRSIAVRVNDRLWPPARTLASPLLLRSWMASETELAFLYSNSVANIA